MNAIEPQLAGLQNLETATAAAPEHAKPSRASTAIGGRARELVAIGISLGITAGALAIGLGAWTVMLRAQIWAIGDAGPRLVSASAPLGAPLDAEVVARGQQLFTASCSACHGPDARGVKGLGKDLVAGSFCRALDDEHLLAFIKKGRDISDSLNTTKVPMPPKGGNPALSDEQLADIITFVRGLQDPRRVMVLAKAETEDTDDAEADGGTDDELAAAQALLEQANALAAAGDEEEEESDEPEDPVQMAERGRALFTSCSACHGPDAKGLKGLGKDLTISEFVAQRTDDELLAFIKRGRDPNDPLNTTKVAMPPKGGNPALDDGKIRDLIAYVRSLQKGAGITNSSND